MIYALVSFIAIFVHIIVNIDVFLNVRKESRFSGDKHYFFFLIAVILFHCFDGAWGVLQERRLGLPLTYVANFAYIMLSAALFLFGLFVYHHLGDKKDRGVLYIGAAVCAIQMTLVVINFFQPLLFEINESGEYIVQIARYVMCGIQSLMFLVIAIYVWYTSAFRKASRRKCLTIGLYSFLMAIAIGLQAIYPVQPMYSAGFLFGVCALHTFVIEEERRTQQIELDQTKVKVLIDPLTGVYSKHAYVDHEAEIDSQINDNKMGPFAVVVFDLNELKRTNDTLGHEAGDEYIIQATRIIAKYFPNINIYRVGGDEFTVIIENDSYSKRDAMLEGFNLAMDENVKHNKFGVVSAGMSDYVPGVDTTIIQVFTRADREMYERKHQLKNQLRNTNKKNTKFSTLH